MGQAGCSWLFIRGFTSGASVQITFHNEKYTYVSRASCFYCITTTYYFELESLQIIVNNPLILYIVFFYKEAFN